MKLAVLLLVVGLFQVVYSNKEGDDHVVMFLEMAQEVAGLLFVFDFFDFFYFILSRLC